MDMEDNIFKDFLAESKENLDRLDQEFVELEENPQNEDLIKSIFRTIHTIKGTAGFFGFTTLEGIAHFSEDILSKLRDKVIVVNEEITTMLLKAVDHIKSILAALESTGKEPDDLAYLDFIVDLRNFAERVVKGSANKEAEPATTAPSAAEESQTAILAENAQVEQTKVEEEVTSGAKADAGPGGPPDASPAVRAKTPPATEAPMASHQMTETHVRVDV